MILAWVIYDQIKWEKRCKEKGWEPALSMSKRLFAYFLCVPFPIIMGVLIGFMR